MATETVIQCVNVGPHIKAARVVTSALEGFEPDDIVFVKDGGAPTPGCVCVIQKPTMGLILQRYKSAETLSDLPAGSAFVGVVYQLNKARF